jgi:hypothetical protein
MDNLKNNFKLADIPKHNIYQVPDKYFDRLPTRVMERTAATDNAKHIQLPQVWRLFRLAVAPVVLVAVFVGVYYFNINKPAQKQTYALGPLAEQEILHYLNNHEDLEPADFAELSILSDQEVTAEFLNISSSAAEKELEYYHIKDLEY